jgi:DNA-nicking Smr family endonuclease
MNAREDKPRRRKLDDKERALWDQITRSVRPLARRPVVAAAPSSGATRPPPSGRASSAMREAAPVRKAPHRLEPMERRQKQRLARGLEPIDARLDLHGKTQAQAHAELLGFLRRAQMDGARFVLVITGKGASAPDNRNERGVLRRHVPLWLNLPELRPYVAAFEQAHVAHGGEGALYVRLRRPRRTG